MIRYLFAFVRLLAFVLFAAAGAASAAPSPCVDNWKLDGIEPTCAELARKSVYEQQVADFIKARDLLYGANFLHSNRSTDDIANAIGVLADFTATALREYEKPSELGPLLERFDGILPWMQQDFPLHGWPKPTDAQAGFRFLQKHLFEATGQERQAIVFEALKIAQIPYVDTWPETLLRRHSKAEREAHRKSEAAARQEASKSSSYADRVIARFTGSQRYDEHTRDMLSFAIETVAAGLILGILLALGALRIGAGQLAAVRVFLITPPALVLSGVIAYVFFAFVGDLGGWGPLLWAALFLVIAFFMAMKLSSFWPDAGWNIHGSARWASFRDMRAARRVRQNGELPQGFALGRAFDAPGRADPRLFHQGHVLTVAPTGTGKGVGAVIPNLLTYEGSAIVLDIKGENFAVTARSRAGMGQEICLIDPFGVTGARPQGFNWFNVIDVRSEDCVSISENLAEMLVIPSQGGGSDSVHFEETARDLLRGLLLFIATLPLERRNMGELRRLITLPLEEFLEVLTDMAMSKQAFGVIARAANSFVIKPEKERGSVLSTAQRHTAFLDDPRIVAALERSDFTMADIKTKAKTVYIVLPPSKLAANSRFLRGFIGLALASITGSNTRPKQPVVFMLDEFAQLGRMAAVEDAISLVRGYGAAFWIFVQDLSQLKAVYPKWQTFLANAAQQYFGVADYDTAHYVSSMLGQTTVEFQTRSSSNQDFTFGGGSTSVSQQFTGRPLLTPDEVMKNRSAIVFIAGERPYGLQPLNYLSDPEYAGLAGLNPYYAAA